MRLQSVVRLLPGLSIRWLKACLGVALVGAAWSISVRPMAADVPGEYDVKAAFILNFARFTEWPENSFTDRSSPLVIAVVGDDPFGGTLGRVIADKAINSHPLTVRKATAAADFTGVNVLFLSGSERSRAQDILRRIKTASILTVSDIDDFCAMGGIIHLTNEQQRIRFEVNLVAAQRAGLNISSKLLGLARAVYTEKGPQ